MNLVAGVLTFPVLARFNVFHARSEDAVRRMEAVGQGILVVVLTRNLAISRGLCAVDALLLALHVVIVMTFWYVFWNGLNFFELFKLFIWD